ncbi:hypothetical protein Val02_07720 [Virgisporangium aliadipatigenens]|uniref:Histone deacetylase n=1 Tax=Virgisporangium aliadipatigenens TaxID=741659 RepID=A0A8J4DNJ5_9ACTN|nr:histone deacetylase [Virgisporangium aliadipatigenens]GIJ43886.1 hypothetical protein Val02_07720 [Virgisporangium aliadipatigenens]
MWYAAYGSNMHAARFRFYLTGGTPPGGLRACPGCRDTRPPRRTAPLLLPGGIHFAWESVTWTGGIAFYDPTLPGVAAARGYLVTGRQFLDIATQEMHRPPPGIGPERLAEAVATGRAVLGDGRYETLVRAGTRAGFPVLTFTAPWSAADVTPNPPAPRYLAMLAGGLHEAHRWNAARIADYLTSRPGVAGHWSRARVARIAARAVRAEESRFSRFARFRHETAA